MNLWFIDVIFCIISVLLFDVFLFASKWRIKAEVGEIMYS